MEKEQVRVRGEQLAESEKLKNDLGRAGAVANK